MTYEGFLRNVTFINRPWAPQPDARCFWLRARGLGTATGVQVTFSKVLCPGMVSGFLQGFT